MFDTSQCIVEFPPDELDFEKWQRLVNMMAHMYESCSAAVIQYRKGTFNVVSTSSNEDNFLSKNEQWSWEKESFCRVIMETKDKLYVNNAKSSSKWSHIASVQEGYVCSYLGFPLFWPDGSLFGSFCVIDSKPTQYSEVLIQAFEQLKIIIESELKHAWDSLKIKSILADSLKPNEINKDDEHEQTLIQRSLQLQESINTATLASLMDVVIRTDKSGLILSTNQAVSSIFGYKRNELVNKNINELLNEEEIQAKLDNVELDYELFATIQARHKDGHVFHIQRTITSIHIAGQTQYIYLISDITDKVQNQKVLKQLALYDGLTDCANRHVLSERFKYEVSRAARENSTFTLAFIDLNNFKPVNDNLGHEAGDLLLVEIASRLKNCVRGHDLVVRFGGDEFIVLFSNTLPQSLVERKINSAVQHEFVYNRQKVTISGSIGIAYFPEDGDTLETLIAVADKKMYEYKAQLKSKSKQ